MNDLKIEELNNIPLYSDYIDVSEELNNLILDIKKGIQSYIDNI